MRPTLKLFSLAAIAVCLLATPTLAAAASPAVALDTSFGTGGRVATGLNLAASVWFADTVQAAPAAGGSILVADNGHVLRYLPNGSLDPSFGTGGVAAIPVPTGAEFLLAGVEMTPTGGALVIGTAYFRDAPIPLPSDSSTPGTLFRREAMVVRLDPQGLPDPSFGSGGVLLTTLGLPAPSDESGRPFEAASLGVADVAFDRQGRAVVAGAYVAAVTYCRDYNNAPIPQAFLARLTPDGAIDPTFGSGGVALDPRLAEASTLRLGPGAAPLVLGRAFGGCEQRPRLFSAYSPTGSPRPGFGDEGMQGAPDSMSTFSLDRKGRVLLANSKGGVKIKARRPKGDPDRGSWVWVSRLRSDGQPDMSFGRNSSSVGLVLPGVRSRLNVVLTMPDGRVVVAAALITGDGKHHGRGYFATFGVAKNGKSLLAPGRFPPHVGFGARASTYTLGALIDASGRLLLFGPLAAPYLLGGEGLGLAAFRIGG